MPAVRAKPPLGDGAGGGKLGDDEGPRNDDLEGLGGERCGGGVEETESKREHSSLTPSSKGSNQRSPGPHVACRSADGQTPNPLVPITEKMRYSQRWSFSPFPSSKIFQNFLRYEEA